MVQHLSLLSTEEIRAIVEDAVQTALANLSPSLLSPSNTPEKLFSREEAAQFLHISLPTLNARMRKGEIPFYQSGRRILFSPNALVKALQENAAKGGGR